MVQPGYSALLLINKCMFLTNVAPFKWKLFRLSNSTGFIAMKHCHNEEMIYQTQCSCQSLDDNPA